MNDGGEGLRNKERYSNVPTMSFVDVHFFYSHRRVMGVAIARVTTWSMLNISIR